LTLNILANNNASILVGIIILSIKSLNLNTGFVAFTIVVAFAIYAPSSSAALVCVFGMVPRFLSCSNPPKLTDADQAVSRLGKDQYDALNWIDRSTALFTAQLGKCMGINGWKRYRFRMRAVGMVGQAVASWDGLRTVDLALENLNGQALDRLLPQMRYSRAEIIRRIGTHLDHPHRQSDVIRVEGELHWDGHGFLEIHPSQTKDVQFLSNSSLPLISQKDQAFVPRLSVESSILLNLGGPLCSQ